MQTPPLSGVLHLWSPTGSMQTCPLQSPKQNRYRTNFEKKFKYLCPEREVLPKCHSREADDALRINIPLLIMMDRSPQVRPHLEERVERRRPTPLQVVVIFPDKIPESSCIAG